jgi:hypothetical protein
MSVLLDVMSCHVVVGVDFACRDADGIGHLVRAVAGTGRCARTLSRGWCAAGDSNPEPAD